MKTRTKINGEFLYQLEQSLPVWLYRDAGTDADDIPVTLVLCEGSRWLNDSEPGNEKPRTLTVHEARCVIRQSFYPAARFHVESPAS